MKRMKNSNNAISFSFSVDEITDISLWKNQKYITLSFKKSALKLFLYFKNPESAEKYYISFKSFINSEENVLSLDGDEDFEKIIFR